MATVAPTDRTLAEDGSVDDAGPNGLRVCDSIFNFTANKLVDNSFAAPAASNCGFLFLDKLVITAGVNLKEGLPAAAGKNTAILQGDTHLGLTSGVLASIP